MTTELAIKIISGDVLGTTEQTNEAIAMAIKALETQTDEAIQKSQELEQAEIGKAYELGKEDALDIVLGG